MKALPILCAAALPLLAGFLERHVQILVSAGRWGPAIGSVLGFNGLFALLAIVLTVVFVIRSRIKAAWISVATATIVSAFLSASSAPLEQYVEKATARDEETKIASWNQSHRNDVVVELKKCATPKIRTYRATKTGSSVYETTASGFRFTGTIENKSSEKISALVFDLSVVSKEQTVTSHRLTFPIEVFPTATLSFEKTFEPIDYKDDPAAQELHRAREQLPNSSWKYTLIAVIPEKLEGVDLRKSLRVESELMETPAPKS